jgi:hypothetical protein
MARKVKVKPTKKRGGQAGNKNAMRHGFFAKSFSADEVKRLDSTDNMDLSSEIFLTRVMLSRLQEEIEFAEVSHMDNNGNQGRSDHYLRQLNTLSALTASQASLIRTQHLVKGKGTDIQTSILTALEELRLEMGI